jgi:hypothetical protein
VRPRLDSRPSYAGSVHECLYLVLVGQHGETATARTDGSRPMPRNHGLELNDDKRIRPARPHPSKRNPEQPIERMQSRRGCFLLNTASCCRRAADSNARRWRVRTKQRKENDLTDILYQSDSRVTSRLKKQRTFIKSLECTNSPGTGGPQGRIPQNGKSSVTPAMHEVLLLGLVRFSSRD